jgi:NhaA family Na+:H+ antiporter
MAKHEAQQHWWNHDAAPGVALIIATAISFALQNSGARGAFDTLLHQPVALELGPYTLRMDLAHFIADGLMAVFFLYVGLELKRETIEGPFRNREEAAAPLVAALGGMVAPALIYLASTLGASSAYARGWAVPSATDIALSIVFL